jgi:hypothetical protein
VEKTDVQIENSQLLNIIKFKNFLIMKNLSVLISTANIAFSCGRAFLAKDRLVATTTSNGKYIYRSLKEINRHNDERVPKGSDELSRYFRPATEMETEAFHKGAKYLRDIPIVLKTVENNEKVSDVSKVSNE